MREVNATLILIRHMKKIFVSLLLVLLSACDLPTDTRLRVVGLEQDFALQEGGFAVVRGISLGVRFEGVPVDERCPLEALCASAGDATVRLLLQRKGYEPATAELHTGFGNSTALYQGYVIELRGLEPGKSVHEPNPDYRVTLRVVPGYVID